MESCILVSAVKVKAVTLDEKLLDIIDSIKVIFSMPVTGHALARVTEQVLVLITRQGCVHPTSRTCGVRKRNQDNTEPESSVLREK